MPREYKRGFTLVEVIIVAVIVLVLAAVAIPLYMAYARDGKISTATHIASTIAVNLGIGIQSGSVKLNGATITNLDDIIEYPDEYKTGHLVFKSGKPGVDEEVNLIIPKGYEVKIEDGEVTVTKLNEKDIFGTVAYTAAK